jgi:hypothetical protein
MASSGRGGAGVSRRTGLQRCEPRITHQIRGPRDATEGLGDLRSGDNRTNLPGCAARQALRETVPGDAHHSSRNRAPARNASAVRVGRPLPDLAGAGQVSPPAAQRSSVPAQLTAGRHRARPSLHDCPHPLRQRDPLRRCPPTESLAEMAGAIVKATATVASPAWTPGECSSPTTVGRWRLSGPGPRPASRHLPEGWS